MAKKIDYPTSVPLKSVKIIDGFNPRKKLGDIEGLIESIKTKIGMTTPLTVRPTEKDGVFELISGHRRLAAAKKAGLESVPVNVKPELVDNALALAAAIAENSEGTRSNLDPIDEAEALKKLVDGVDGVGGVSTAKAAKQTGYSDQHIRNCIKLVGVSPEIQKRVRDGELTKTTAIALSALDEPMQKKVLPEITKNMSEKEVKKLANDIMRADAQKDGGEVKGKKNKSKGGRRATPGGDDGTFSVWRTHKEVGSKMEELAVAIRDAGKEADTSMLKGALSALLWAAGKIEEVDTDSKEYKVAYKAVIEAVGKDAEEPEELEADSE